MPPNSRQLEAIRGGGIQLVVAGPGSGKTRVITGKIEHLLEQGVLPSAILALTFSEKAAREMESRLERLSGSPELTVRTFHSFCLDVLKENVLESGLNFSAGLIRRTHQLAWGLRNIDRFGFSGIQVGNNAAGAIEAVIDGIAALRDELVGPEDLAAYIEARRALDLPPAERVRLDQLADLHAVYAAYERYKRQAMLLDYGDMIAAAVRLFQERPHILDRYRQRYRHVLVDEFQDTNYAQYTLIRLLCGDHLCVVGDDDQTIYRFRGACYGNFQEFRGAFDTCRETLLDQNYRNSGTILALALQLMENAPDRTEKPLVTQNPAGEKVVAAECEDEQTEALYVLQEIQHLIGTPFFSRRERAERPFCYRDIAILCRRRAEGMKFFRTLRRHGIRCEFIGEVDLFAMPLMRDLLAYLQAIDNPLEGGIPLNRILRRSGVPEPVVRRINAAARDCRRNGGDGVYEAMQAVGTDPRVGEVLQQIADLIEKKAALPLPALVHEVMMRRTSIYRDALREPDGQQRLVLDQVFALVQDYDAIARHATLGDLLRYLDNLPAFSLDLEEREEPDAVQIMTIHRSKGKEFPVVFLTDLAHRRFPGDYRRRPFAVPADLARGRRSGEDERALYLQEERRLAYVAMTRAEERLYLTRARFYGEGRREVNPSPFLTELDYANNPRIRVVSVPARDTVLRPVADSPLDRYRHTLQDEIVRAVAELRTQTALARLLELEKVRLLMHGADPRTFDRTAFLQVPEDDTALERLRDGRRPSPVPEDRTFSASALQTYRECPLRYKFQHVLLVPSIPKPFYSLGSAVHAAIEHLSRDQMRGIPPDIERARRYLDAFWEPDGFESRTQETAGRQQAERLLSRYLAWQAENGNRILEVEHPFQLRVNGRTFRGIVDRVEQTPRGGYVVLDFKSGSSAGGSPAENLQLNLYSMAVRQIYGRLPERATLFAIRDGAAISYYPTEGTVSAFTARLADLLERIRSGEFPPTPSQSRCRGCDYASLCPAGESGTDP